MEKKASRRYSLDDAEFVDDVLPVTSDVHEDMYRWAADLFPICRSLCSEGNRETLRYLKALAPEIQINEVPTGTQCFDWEVPEEWNISEAYLLAPDGTRVLDFCDNNLHVVGYSIPVDAELSLEELLPHLHSDEKLPDAIPYLTSYYRRTWGFCLSHKRLQSLEPGRYRAVIRSTIAPGSMSYGEVVLPGETDEEIFFSTYICHPSMANNELSGPVVATALLRWLSSLESRRYTYRFAWVPETLGSIAYLSRNLERMKARVRAGYVVTCVGDERAYSFLPSRAGNTLADRAALHVLSQQAPQFQAYSFLERGADERQYCFPGVDLPVASVMRSKYDSYPEYHTSLDDMALISPRGLGGAYEIYRGIVAALELNVVYRTTTLCEPCLGKRSLYPTLSRKESFGTIIQILNVLSYSDGTKDLFDLGNAIRLPFSRCIQIARRLENAGLLERVS